jgi:hypothetical protein
MTIIIPTKFQSKSLGVDWISFKFPDLDNSTQEKIVGYLSQLGFDSYRESGKFLRPIKERISPDLLARPFEVLFVDDNPHWTGTLLHFSGSNAEVFYRLASQKLIDWNIFSSATLSRLDIFYLRAPRSTDQLSGGEFLEKCYQKLKLSNRNVKLAKNSKGDILSIGSRRSNHYYRIYEAPNNSLKFEYEIKGKFLFEFHSLLVTNDLKEFEDQLANRFFVDFAKLIPLHYPQVDWLVIQLRPIRKNPMRLTNSLNSHYIQIQDSVNHQEFVIFLQFLAYAKKFESNQGTLGGVAYREITFEIQDFLAHQYKSTNYYQLKKMKDFFESLQNNLFVTSFTDTYFRRLATIPQVRFQKSTSNAWVVKVWILEELFSYQYPFLLPNFFLGKHTKYQFAVQFEIFQVFSSVPIEKVFQIQTFLQNYPTSLSNQQKAAVKRYFIEVVQLLQKHDLIENRYSVISNGNICSVDKLTTFNISQGFIIYEKLFSK